MKKSTSVSILLFSIVSALWLNGAVLEGPREVESWFKRLNREKQPEKMTKLHFYFHDLLQGKTVTSAVVAQPNMTGSSPTFSGSFIIADDPLTAGPGFLSKRVGYAKGFYGAASFEEVGLIMAMTFVFTDEIYNGISLSVLGHNPDRHMYREVPIVGGSSLFRLARGTATLRNYYFDTIAGNATVEVDSLNSDKCRLCVNNEVKRDIIAVNFMHFYVCFFLYLFFISTKLLNPTSLRLLQRCSAKSTSSMTHLHSGQNPNPRFWVELKS